jgi:(p)ppGpp synthase/HD superfamily hydrolase
MALDLMVTLDARFADAFAYANAVHRNQRRKGTEIPYISHLLAVASIVLQQLHHASATLADLKRDGSVVWNRFKGGRDDAIWELS